MSKTLVLINERFSDNIGDQAIAEAAAELLSSYGHSIQGLDYSFRTKFKGIGSSKGISALQKLPKWFVQIGQLIIRWNEAEKRINPDVKMGVIGGGQLILSNDSFPISLFLWCRALHKKKVPISLLSVGVGDRFTAMERYLVARALKKVGTIYVRDQRSQENLEKFFNRKADFLPDVVYSYQTNVKANAIREGLIVAPVEYHVHAKYYQELGEELLSPDRWSQLWIELVLESAEKGETIHLVGTTLKDYDFAKVLKEKLSMTGFNSVHVHDMMGWKTFMELALASRMLISGRMHALIFGHIAHCKIKPIILSNKIKAFSKEYLSQQSETLNESFVDNDNLRVKLEPGQ